MTDREAAGKSRDPGCRLPNARDSTPAGETIVDGRNAQYGVRFDGWVDHAAFRSVSDAARRYSGELDLSPKPVNWLPKTPVMPMSTPSR